MVNDASAVFRRVAVGCDHGGIALKETVVRTLEGLGISVEDCGTHSEESVDYPIFARRVAEAVARRQVNAGILLCGTGIGMAVCANKVPGVRAAVCGEPHSVRLTREHNDANVLAMGARVIGPGMAEELVTVFCTTNFGGGRHERRVKAISEMEEEIGRRW